MSGLTGASIGGKHRGKTSNLGMIDMLGRRQSPIVTVVFMPSVDIKWFKSRTQTRTMLSQTTLEEQVLQVEHPPQQSCNLLL